MTAPDDPRAQAAGECDVAAIGARLHAIDREGVRSIDDALVMGAAITDPSTGDVEWILRHAPDVIDCLADAVRRFTAAAADAFADRVRACHAAAARIDRYTLPAEVLALIADVPALLADLTRLRAHAAGEPARVAAAVAAAVAAEGAIALLSRTLGCESGDPASIVREALDYAAEMRERAEVYEESGDEPGDVLARIATAEAERDAAVTAHAALAGAVRAEREARAHMRRIERNPDETVAEIDEAGRSVRGAMDRTDALLRGAPGGYVEARVVREYLAALDVLPGDLATINAAIDRERTARTALDAALLAATTTPEESL